MDLLGFGHLILRKMISWETLKEGFEIAFGEPPKFMARAPGRVNLIGEHIDYIGGHVLPIAVDRGVGAAMGETRGELNEVISKQYDARKDGEEFKKVQRFVQELQAKLNCPPIKLFVDSDLPVGAGLSSSASFSVAVSSAMIRLTGESSLSALRLAELCMESEHSALGTGCGLMDPYTSLFAVRGCALLIDCAEKTHRLVPCQFHSASLVVINSGQPRTLAESGYNQRKRELTEALEKVKKTVSGEGRIWGFKDEALSALPKLPETLARRLRHALTEDERVFEFAEALGNRDLARLGQLLLESHKSLRDDYEVSTNALDFIVDTLLNSEGVLGARLVGGGFGGSVLALIESKCVEDALESLAQAYLSAYRLPIKHYLVSPHDCAEILVEGRNVPVAEFLQSRPKAI